MKEIKCLEANKYQDSNYEKYENGIYRKDNLFFVTLSYTRTRTWRRKGCIIYISISIGRFIRQVLGCIFLIFIRVKTMRVKTRVI